MNTINEYFLNKQFLKDKRNSSVFYQDTVFYENKGKYSIEFRVIGELVIRIDYNNYYNDDATNYLVEQNFTDDELEDVDFLYNNWFVYEIINEEIPEILEEGDGVVLGTMEECYEIYLDFLKNYN